MNCTPSVEKNKEIIKDLLTLDPLKYKNFNNVARFILDAPISKENQVVSLNIISQLFVALNEKNSMFELGDAEKVARKEELLSDYTKYLNVVKGILKYKSKVGDTYTELVEHINNIAEGKVSIYDSEDIKANVLKHVASYFNNTKFESEEERNKKIVEITKYLNYLKSKSPIKEMLDTMFEEFLDTLGNSTNYLNINQALENNQDVNTYLITLNTNEVVEAKKEKDIFYDLNTGKIIPDGSYQSIKKALYQRENERGSDKISFVLTPNSFLSGLTIRPFSTTENYIDLINSFADVTNPDTDIKIYAVKLNSYTDERINRINAITGFNKEYETFESEAQAEYLNSDSNASVIALLRQKKSEDKFTIVGEITTTNKAVKKFYIHGLDNIGLLNSNNEVLKLDLTKDEHLQLVQEHAINVENNKSTNLDEFNLLQLKQIATQFKDFKNSINKKISKDKNVSIDITNEFNTVYQIEKNISLKRVETLEEAKVSSPNIYHEVLVAQYDTEGNIISQKQKSIPFHYKKDDGQSLSYKVTNFLNKNERILYDGKDFSIAEYLDYIGLSENFLIDVILKNKDYNSVFLTKNKDGNYSFRVGKYAEPIANQILFTNFLSDMASFMEAPDRNKIFNNSFWDQYSFRAKKDKNGEYKLSVNFASSPEGELQIEIRPFARTLRYDYIKKDKGSFNFPLGKNVMNKLLQSFIPNAVDYASIKASHSFLNDIELYDTSGELIKSNAPLFIKALYTNKIIGKDPIIENILKNLKNAQDKFNDIISYNVIDFIKDPENNYLDFISDVEEDFGDLKNVFFNVYEGDFKVPYVKFGNTAITNVNNNLNIGTEGYYLVNNVSSSIGVVSRNNIVISKAQRETINKIAPINNKNIEEPKKLTEEDKEIKNAEELPLAVAEEQPVTQGTLDFPFTITEAENFEDTGGYNPDILFSTAEDRDIITPTQKDLENEYAWFTNTYAKFFDLQSLTELGDITDLVKLDGSILGAFKDRVIYLNDTLKDKGTLYHECFHGVFRYLMTNPERTKLINEIIQNKKYSSKFTQEYMQHFSDKRNILFNEDNIKNLIAEEILADGFQNYMNNKMEPKGLLQKLFELLKKVLNFFNVNKDIIDSTYERIRNKKYSSVVDASEIYNKELALLNIPTLIETVIDAETKAIKTRPSQLSVKLQNQLIDSVVQIIVENNTKNNSFVIQDKTFDQKFDEAADYLLKNTWNINNLFSQVDNNVNIPSERKERLKTKIINKYANTYSNYAFMLGARMKHITVYDINNTGIAAKDKQVIRNNIKTSLAEPVKDNTMGQVSYYLLKEEVRKKYEHISNLVNFEEEHNDDEQKDFEDVLKKIESPYANEQNDFDDEMDDSLNNVFEDKSLAEKGGIESLPKEIREFLSIINYEKEDTEIGITVPRYVDGYEMFGIILKISADIDRKDIVDNIKVVSETLKEDGIHIDEATDLLKIHDYIKEKCKITTNEFGVKKIKNAQFYNIFVTTVIKASVDYVMYGVENKNYKPIGNIDNQDIITDTNKEEQIRISKVEIFDKILTVDINRKKNNLITKLISTYNDSRNDLFYKKELRELNKLCDIIVNNDPILSMSSDSTIAVDAMAKQLSNAFKNIGLDLPKSLIRLSILAIERKTNSNSPRINPESVVEQHYQNNERFVQENKYLEKSFFSDFQGILKELYDGKLSSTELSEKLDDTTSAYGRLSIIMRNAASYIVKYDPTELPSIYRNAEGKPVYRYIPYTPVLLIAKDIRQKGLVESFKSDEFFANSEAYLKNNPYFKDLFLNIDSETSRKMMIYFNNFYIDLFGGVNQKVDDNKKDGKVFKQIDERSQHVLNLLGFLKRTTSTALVNNELTNLVTYKRMYTTIEATNTNYLMPAVYEQYANENGIITNDGIIKPVEKLLEKIKQEFYRIQNEYKDAARLKDDFDNNRKSEGKRLLNKYNAAVTSDNKADITKDDLRAFNFNYLRKYFKNNQDIKKYLIDYAKSGKAFDKIPASKLKDIKNSLNEYALSKLEEHIQILESKGIISKTKSIDPIFKDYYSSDLLPLRLETDLQKVLLKDVYGTIGLNWKNVVADSYFNYWINSLFFNEVFDGDIALGVKNDTDYGKRQKRNAASNDNMGAGYLNVAMLNTIKAYVHPEYLGFGPYYSINEIEKDPRLEGQDDLKSILKSNYGKKVKVRGIDIDTMVEVFDGQSVSLLMHHMDMYDKIGRINPIIEDLLIKKHYRTLTKEELNYLKKNKVVLNSKKTVTASRASYHKLSEVYIDRNDVSVLNIPEGKTIDEVYTDLHSLYSQIYNLRLVNNALLEEDDFSNNDSTKEQIKELYSTIHAYYKPIPSRIKLHNLLNSIEYHNIDQMMDTTASKLATVLPTNDYDIDSNGYINLEKSSLHVPNQFKFWQVETSGIKSIIKYSVQSKVLIPANLKDINAVMKNNGEIVSESEQEDITNEMNDLLFQYHSTLKDVAESQEALMNAFFTHRGDDDLNVAFMFNLIRKNLSAQGVSSNRLKLFEVDPVTGKPIHSANLPEIRDMLKYYFFSQFSKFTDEKGSGGKYIHMSSYGYDIMVDENDQPITTENYKTNPELYPNARFRPLSVSIEKVGDKNVYFVECILPKSLKNNNKLLKKYKNQLTKMFGTRIPTEDKRSMVALKVVDYIDSANMSGIIVPPVIHILSGSDLDVDTLYTQQYSFYTNFNGEEILYGDYKGYKNKDEGEFIEYLNYLTKDKDLSPLIKQEFSKISDSLNLKQDTNVENILKVFRYNPDNFDLNAAFALFKNNNLENINIKDLKQELEDIYNSEVPLNSEITRLENQIKDYYTIKKNVKYISTYIKIQSSLNVLSEFKLPISTTAFKTDRKYALLVKDKYQNFNLDAKLKILSNEHVFNNLYINERSSTQMFLDLLSDFGTDLDKAKENFDPFTIDGVIDSRNKNVLGKIGIGGTANMNKTLAFLSQYFNDNLDGNFKEPVWIFRKDVTQDAATIYNKFAGFSENKMRTIAIIGNILGMFADGAKEPIPAALNLNEINTDISLGMIASGLDLHFTLALNFLNDLQEIIETVKAADYAITDTAQKKKQYLKATLNAKLEKINTKDNKVLIELKNLGLVSKKSGIKNLEINKDNLIIKYNITKFDEEKLKNRTLTLKDLGIEVSVRTSVQSIVDGEKDITFVEQKLSDDAQRVIIIDLYKQQSLITSKIKSAGNIVNMFKRINPNFYSFDKIKKDIKDLKNGNSIVEDEVSNRIFDKNQVWSVIDRLVDQIDEKSKMFIERSAPFIPIRNAFEGIFKDSDNFAKVVTSYIGLKKLKLSYISDILKSPGYENLSEATKKLKKQEDILIQQMFTADYWFTNNLEEELTLMQRKYPDNELLKRLRILKTEKGAVDTDMNFYDEKFISIVGKAKISGKLQENIENDADNLSVVEPLFFKKMFFHDLVRTGLRPRDGSYLQYLNPDYKLPISKYIDEFSNILNKGGDLQSRTELLMKYLDTDNVKDVYDFMYELFANVVYTASSEIDNIKLEMSAPSSLKLEKIAKKLDFSQLIDPEVDPLEELFNYILPARFSERGVLYRTFDILDNKNGEEILKLNSLSNKIVFNLNIPNTSYGNITRGNLIDIADNFGIKNDAKLSKFVFPSVIKIKGLTEDDDRFYILQGVDEKANNHVGSNLMDVKVLEAKQDFITDYNTGSYAVYIKIPAKPNSMSISTTALDLKQIQRYMDLVDGNVKLGTPVKDISSTDIEPVDINSYSQNSQSLNTNIYYNNDINTLRQLHNTGKLIYTMRVSEKQEKSQYNFNDLGVNRNFGNPFTGTKKSEDLIQMGPHDNAAGGSEEERENIEAAVEAYEQWLDGTTIFTDRYGKEHDLSSINNRRDWILENIKILKEKAPVRLGYFKSGYRSHADVLNERINGDKKLQMEDYSFVMPHVPVYYNKEVISRPDTPLFNTLPSKSPIPTMTYAGIGSRETPEDIQKEMTKLAVMLKDKGYTLRSGGAQGADIAFERGAGKQKEIFLGSKRAGEKEHLIAREIHPAPEALDNSKSSSFIWNLMARNTNQIFGKELDTPVDFVLAWTQDGLVNYINRSIKSGGTGQAIDMASRKGIPVINLANENWQQQLEDVLNNKVELSEEEQLQEDILNINYQISEINEQNEAMKQSNSFIIADNLPRITPESAEAETGLNAGNKSDISTSLLSKKGVSVEQAAYDIWENYFVENNILDTEDIRTEIIDILNAGSIKAFKDNLLNTNKLENLKRDLANKKDQLKNINKPIVTKAKEVAINKEVKEEPKKPKGKLKYSTPTTEQLDLFSETPKVEEKKPEIIAVNEPDINEEAEVAPESVIKVNEEFSIEEDLNDLYMSEEVLDYLYNDSKAKTMGINLKDYTSEVMKLISNLRGSLSNSEIIEKLKCL